MLSRIEDYIKSINERLDKKEEQIDKTDEIFCKLLDLNSRLQVIESVKPEQASVKAEMHPVNTRRGSVMEKVNFLAAKKEEPKLRRVSSAVPLKKRVIEDVVPDVAEKIQLFSQSDWSKINEQIEKEEREKRKEEKRKRSFMN